MQSHMSHIWISDAAFYELIVEADRTYPLETGGVLVGYFADNGEPVIGAVVGPGPDAVHRPTRFLPDHSWQCGQLDELFARSSGALAYIGDWHTHPNGSPQMSWLDKRTLRRIAKHTPALIQKPLMLIGGGRPANWLWNGHQYCGEHLHGLIIKSSSGELRQFHSTV
jgi:integrative and conjugative element protein (TIGR02256 family)